MFRSVLTLASKNFSRPAFRIATMSTLKIGTHNGAFHCDEALAVAMLRTLSKFKDAELIRTRDPTLLEPCDIVVDVGGVYDHAKQRYDHHQKEFNESVSSLMPGKKWTTKLSSAGLVYVHYGKEIIAQVLETTEEDLIDKVFDKVYAGFMEEIDANDNGISTHDGEPRYQISTTLPQRVGNLRPAWNDAVQDFDKGFEKAMALVLPEFLDKIRYYGRVWWPARGVVAKAINERFETHPSGRIISFESGGVPYTQHLYELEEEQEIEGQVLFAIFTDPRGQWRVSTINVKDQAFVSRMKLHPDWLALRDQELSEKSGIEGCVFVHAAGFIGGNKTRDGVLKMAEKTLEYNGN